MLQYLFSFLLIFIFFGCSKVEKKRSTQKIKKEKITRLHTDKLSIKALKKTASFTNYPWQQNCKSINKYHFRCKGDLLNPARIISTDDEKIYYHDCNGFKGHSLPIVDHEEFIYPILIDILNYIEFKTGHKIVITSGHRCPQHNSYVDSSAYNQTTKHLIGAAVDFYVEGMQECPEKVVEVIKSFYLNSPKYENNRAYQEFSRFSKLSQTNTSIMPWFNKEIFIKVLQPSEGRNFDNQHVNPYISIQVRYDFDKKEPVTYSWAKAHKGYYR